MSLAHLSHGDAKSSQANQSPHFFNTITRDFLQLPNPRYPHRLTSYTTQNYLEKIGKMEENFCTHSSQNDLSYRLRIASKNDKGNQNLHEEIQNTQYDQNLLEKVLDPQDDMEVLNSQNPSSSHSPNSQKISHITLKKQKLKQEREELVRTLRNNFTIKPEEKEQLKRVAITIGKKPPWIYKTLEDDSEIQRNLDIKILKFLDEANCEDNTPNFRSGISKSSRAYDPVPNAVFKRAQLRTFECAQCIHWVGSESFKNEIRELVHNMKNSKEINCQEGYLSRIEDISTIGVTFIKIISKFHAKNPRSKEFGENQNILRYTRDIWKICFPNRENKAYDIARFCKSLGAESETAIEKCLKIKFNSRNSGLNQIISAMRDKIPAIKDKVDILQCAWYFALVRASVFYPEEILISDSSEVKKSFRNFISNGLMYFVYKAGENYI
ncbi:hypothetical protein BY996DRAFT_8684761 [Phakopsora pachyrhizi]|nr:hypothetical protein BY996DRAFT_8684761 [Phakopsora pachyrhizi]